MTEQPRELTDDFEEALDPAPFEELSDAELPRFGKPVQDAVCLSIVSDPDTLLAFLRVAGRHCDHLDAMACVDAVRLGKASAALLLPESGERSWAERGALVKRGAQGVSCRRGRPGRPTSRNILLYSEHDLVREFSPRAEDLPSPLVDQMSDAELRALEGSFEVCRGNITPDLVAALKLRHGVEPALGELRCSDGLSSGEAALRCEQLLRDLRECVARFDDTLASRIASIRESARGDAAQSLLRGASLVSERPAAVMEGVKYEEVNFGTLPKSAAREQGAGEAADADPAAVQGPPAAKAEEEPAPQKAFSPAELIALMRDCDGRP